LCVGDGGGHRPDHRGLSLHETLEAGSTERMDSILNWITYIPLFGALVILFFQREARTIKITALAFAVLDLFVSLRLWFNFDPKASGEAIFQFRWTTTWIESLGVNYDFGADGIAVLLIILTTFMGVIAIWSSFS